jgi:hypothetical protein
MLFELFAVLFSAQIVVNRNHALFVFRLQAGLFGAPVQVQPKQRGHVRHLAGQRNHKRVLEVQLFQIKTLGQLERDLSQGIVVEPENLKRLELAYAGVQPNQVIKAEVEANQLRELKYLGQNRVHV